MMLMLDFYSYFCSLNFVSGGERGIVYHIIQRLVVRQSHV